MMEPILEIACFNYASAIIAKESGAHRIEYCRDFSTGGLTPDLEETKKLIQEVNIPVFVMIRPRAGNFVFSQKEFEHFTEWIPKFKAIGVSGFVFGILNPDHTVDLIRNALLVKLADPLPCTFHRAFDQGPDLLQSLETVIACGFKRLLTSGGKGNANDNLHMLAQLQRVSSKRLIILPGGGVRSENIHALKDSVHTHEFHTSAITNACQKADPEEIKAILRILHQ